MQTGSTKLLVDSVRSAHNVGSLFRTAEIFGVDEIILTGISPYPRVTGDTRPPQVIERNERMIAKTALDAQQLLPYRYIPELANAITELRSGGCHLYALEQADSAVALSNFKPDWPCALIVGHELAGVHPGTLEICDAIIEIPQIGRKDSLNVAVAAGIALYALRWPVKK